MTLSALDVRDVAQIEAARTFAHEPNGGPIVPLSGLSVIAI
jgi:hypothetical protein